MANRVILDTVLNLAIGSVTQGKQFEKELAKYIAGAVTSGSEEGSKKSSKKVAGEWSKTFSSLMEVGLKKSARAFRDSFNKINKSVEQYEKQLSLVHDKIQKTEDKALKDSLRQQKRELQQRIDMQKKAQERLEAAANREAAHRMKIMEAHEERLQMSRTESAQQMGDTIGDALKNALSVDNLGATGLADAITGGLGAALTRGAGAAGASGNAAMFSSLAASAAAIAAVAGPIAGLTAVIAEAYGHTKDMNKELLGASSVFDLVGSNAQTFSVMGADVSALQVRLASMRKEVADVAYDFRLTQEEVTGVVNAMSEAGITFREMSDITRQNTGDFESFQDVTRSAIAASHGLGIEVSSVAEFYDKMTRDLGYNLDNIEGAFGLISSEAQNAGMRTKDFFAAINEASSGMALYNFRVNDTVGLFGDLVDILGEDLAKQKLGLEGTFRGMGMQERYKQTLLGGRGMGQAVKADAAAQAKVFADSLKGTPAMKALEGRGLAAGGAIDMRALAGMTGKEFREVLTSPEISAVQKRQLTTLRELSFGGQGGMGTARALGSLSKLGELAATFAQGSTMSGGKSLMEMQGVQRMMMEEVLGISGEEFDIRARLQQQMLAEYERLQRESPETVKGKSFEEALTEGLLTKTEDLEKIGKKQFSLVENNARDSLKETRSISTTVKNQIVGFLDRIATGVDIMATFLAPSGQKQMVQDRRASIEKQAQLTDSISALSDQIAEKKYALEAASSEEERAKLKGDIASLEKQRGGMKSSLERERKIERGIVKGGSRGSALAGSFDLDKVKALGPDKLRAAGLGSLVKLTPGMGGAKDVVELNSLNERQATVLEALLEKQEKEEVNQKLRDEDLIKTDKEGFEDLIKTINDMGQKQALQQLTSYLGRGSAKTLEAALQGDSGSLARVKAMIAKEGSVSESEAMLLAQAGFDLEALGVQRGRAAKDFIYRGDGNRGMIQPIDRMDQFFGVKPGGAVNQAVSGGGKDVTININGGDEGRVYQVVKRVLSETGYGNLKSY